MNKIVFILAVTALVASITGCTQRLTDFTIISSKNVDLSRGAEFSRGERVEGEDTKVAIIFPLGVPNAKEAMDQAIQSVSGCVALADGVLEQEWFYLYFGYFKYRVKGTCLIDPKLVNAKEYSKPVSMNENPSTKKVVSKVDPVTGNIIQE